MGNSRFSRIPLGLSTVCTAATVWSFLGTQDRGVWAFEVVPLGLGLLAVGACAPRFRFTSLTNALLATAFVVQCLGGRYTFAEVPVPHALLDAFGLDRNPVDRVGHFLQGFVAAMFLRELLLRVGGVRRGPVLFWLVTGTCLGFSAFYELLEAWVVMLFYPDAGPDWLGTQGDPWDAQWDMTTALVGALVAQVTLSGWQAGLIARLASIPDSQSMSHPPG